MKKSFIFILMVLILVGCEKKGKKNELYLFNWADYIPNEVIVDFENETGIKVITDYYSSNEEMYAKIKGGEISYDITVPSIDYAEMMLKQGMLEKIDRSKISNLNELNEDIASKINFDKDHNYVIPYSVGAIGIAVNKKYIKNFKRSFDIYNRKDLRGKMVLLDDMREVMSSALMVAGHSPESSDPQELANTKKIILGWRENILKFENEFSKDKFIDGKYLVVQGYYENIMAHITDEEAKNIAFFIPKIGGQMYIDGMVILKGAKNIENAHKFMDYIHRPKVYAKIIDYLGIPSINLGANKFRKTKPGYDIDDLKKTHLIRDLGEALHIQNKVWNDILTQ